MMVLLIAGVNLPTECSYYLQNLKKNGHAALDSSADKFRYTLFTTPTPTTTTCATMYLELGSLVAALTSGPMLRQSMTITVKKNVLIILPVCGSAVELATKRQALLNHVSIINNVVVMALWDTRPWHIAKSGSV
jgi:hypothetical protein